jgi:GntR family transcriptional regulator
MTVERAKPLADQVNQIMRERIRQQDYAPGQRLPAESELAEEFGVSRATIRSVLARLDVEGLIIRKQGDGTYINQRLPEVNTHLGGLWEFSQLIKSSGYEPSIRLINTQYRAANQTDADTLGLSAGDEVLVLDRVFLADDRPVIVAQNILPRKMIHAEKIDGQLHIRDFLKRYCQVDIAYAIIDISALIPDQQISSLLQRDSQKPLLKLLLRFYDRNNQPLLYGHSYLDDADLNLRLVQAWG